MKVSELEGALLDYWVAKAEGFGAELCGDSRGAFCIRTKQYVGGGSFRGPFCPSTEWADGGPIIERDQIFLNPPSEVHYNGGPNAGWKRYDHWRATVSARTRTLPPQNETQQAMGVRPVGRGSGATALIAAMRAKVASHFGDEVPEVAHV